MADVNQWNTVRTGSDDPVRLFAASDSGGLSLGKFNGNAAYKLL
jgi:hypothetical protein